MAILEILEFPDPRLRTVAQPVEQFDDALVQFITDMTETMYAAQGIGLAASQVDRHQRILVLDVSDGQNQPMTFINPEILAREGEERCEEGCLSVPGVYAEVKRAQTITVRAQRPDGSTFETEADGMLAICLQHEMDHLDGKLFVDYLSPLKRQMVRKKLEKARRQHRAESPARSAI